MYHLAPIVRLDQGLVFQMVASSWQRYIPNQSGSIMALFWRGSPLVYVACSLAFLFMLYELIPRSPIPESANVPTKVDFYNSN